MISFLRGRVLEKHPNRLTVDVQGVGYDVHVPLSTYYRVAEPPGEVALRVYTHVREDALQLFGFLTDLERQLFERLIGVSGTVSMLAPPGRWRRRPDCLPSLTPRRRAANRARG